MKKLLIYITALASVFLLTIQAKASTEFEPNDSFSTATILEQQNNIFTVNGDFSENYDNDYYSFTLTEPGKIEVKINRSLNTQYRVTLYNAAQNNIEDNYTYLKPDNGPETLFSQGLQAGTYYIKINRYNGEKTPYTLEIAYTKSDFFEKEKNNERTSANLIQVNQTYSGFADLYTEDYFVVETPANGEVKIDLSRSLQTSYNISLLNSAGETLKNLTTELSDASLKNAITIGLPKGLYYIRINASQGIVNNVPYDVRANFKEDSFIELEPNNTIYSANPITINNTFRGYLDDWISGDHYRLELTKNQNLSFHLTGAPQTSFSVKIFNQDNSVTKYYYTSHGNGKLQNIANLSLKKGTYYVQISHSSGLYDQIPYTLRVNERDITPPAQPAVNTVKSSHTTVTGTAEKGATIIVYKGSKAIGKATVGKDSKYSVKIAKQPKKTTLRIVAVDTAGNRSKARTIVVQ